MRLKAQLSALICFLTPVTGSEDDHLFRSCFLFLMKTLVVCPIWKTNTFPIGKSTRASSSCSVVDIQSNLNRVCIMTVVFCINGLFVLNCLHCWLFNVTCLTVLIFNVGSVASFISLLLFAFIRLLLYFSLFIPCLSITKHLLSLSFHLGGLLGMDPCTPFNIILPEKLIKTLAKELEVVIKLFFLWRCNFIFSSNFENPLLFRIRKIANDIPQIPYGNR